MAGELLTQVDILEKGVERLERLLSKLDPQELIRLRSQTMDLYARIKRWPKSITKTQSRSNDQAPRRSLEINSHPRNRQNIDKSPSET